MSEDEDRAKIVAEALSWVKTPYVSGQMVKGPRGGTDCAMLLYGVYTVTEMISTIDPPEKYSPQWHLHQSDEKYMKYVLRHAHEIPGPPEPGDIVMFKIGHVFAHGAIVVEWPKVIHAVGKESVLPCDISKNTTGRRALARVEQKFFSLWKPK